MQVWKGVIQVYTFVKSTQYDFILNLSDVTKPWNYEQELQKNPDLEMKSLRGKHRMFKSERNWTHKDRKERRSETADGKRQDEEGGEMGFWVVLSGGQGDGGGRICLC